MVVSTYFKKHRGFAIAITSVGDCLSGFISPVIANYLLENYGYISATAISGALVLNQCVGASLYQPVFAFCSDNEAKMKLLKEKMKEDDELKTIISYGCSAHYINLLEQEVTPNSVLKYIIQIQKFFRNHHQPHGWLKEKGGLMPQIPNDTRWNSQQACINTFIQNYYKYVEIANEDKLEMSITNILSNPSLYREARHLQKQVDVVSKALDKLQSDTATLSIAVNEWLVLLESEVLDPYKANIRKRMERSYRTIFLCGKHDGSPISWKKFNFSTGRVGR
ncbi:hypothetical protein Avbf_08565 [Armadillidium vulgare]|nr:hypothetical protein Avbf_08565 [Armadillidium vulgare]